MKDKETCQAAGEGSSDFQGTEGIWTFVFIDMIVFLLIFFVFIGERMRQFDLYCASQQHLNEILGLANTLILITSSLMVVKAIHAARGQTPKKVSVYLLLAFLLGMAFSINKLFEYHSKFEAGITPITNPFFSFYFVITIVHFLHVLVGMIFIFHYKNNAGRCLKSGHYITGLENVGLYWHFVDVIWLFIFPLFYLVGRQ